MKQQFIMSLNRRLRVLKRSERDRYVRGYEEMIQDRTEAGDALEKVISEMESIEEISHNILCSYRKCETGKSSFYYFNKWYIAQDAVLTVFSFLTAMLVYLFPENNAVFHWQHIVTMLFMIAIEIAINALLGSYTIETAEHFLREIRNFVISSLIGVCLVFFLLYFFKWILVTRLLLLIFLCIHLVLGIAFRVLLRKTVLPADEKYLPTAKIKLP